jgi:DNA repair exonuclease SbcCD nuclease subunit
MTRILHTADLHLEHRFGGPTMTAGEARRRRHELRTALERIVDLALEREVDALTIAGDLYEHEHASDETGRFIARQFRRLAPVPVLIAPGNHDPHVAGSLYQGVRWPENVTVFDSRAWRPVRVAPDVVVWGIGHDGPDMRRDVLRELRLDGSATGVLLFHGRDASRPAKAGATQCPFSPAEVRASGAAFALLGHEHTWRASDAFAYPGSPEPLGFFTAGSHYAALATIASGSVRVEPLQVSTVSYCTVPVDVTRCAGAGELRRALERRGAGVEASAIVRFVLTGERPRGLPVDENELLRGLAGRLRYAEVVDATVARPVLARSRFDISSASLGHRAPSVVAAGS